MLYAPTSSSTKRRRLRAALRDGALIRMPGAFSPLVARLIQEQGWEGVYVSGSVVAADLGLPDIGLTSLHEVVGRARQIARVTDLPALLDVDTGFGEPMNVARTVQEAEDAGVAAVHLEDQVNPKRCGHLDHKTVVDVDTMVRRIQAAVGSRRDPDLLLVARTDARAVEGLEAAIARARRYVDAGADIIFPEALASESEFAAFRKAIEVPMLANMTEFGKSPLLTTRQLANLGYNLVIYPVTTLRIAMAAVERALARIRAEGTQEDLVGSMQTRARLYDLLDYERYGTFDRRVFDFDLDDS
jgi:methylisocitrate lyase